MKRKMTQKDWDKEPLGVEPDADIARRLGCSREYVRQMRNQRGIPKCPTAATKRSRVMDLRFLLGIVSDEIVAKEARCAPSYVGTIRRELEIPHYTKSCWESEDRLGKMPDTALARLLGVAQTTVCRARNRLGIPPFTPKGARGIDWDNRAGRVERNQGEKR